MAAVQENGSSKMETLFQLLALISLIATESRKEPFRAEDIALLLGNPLSTVTTVSCADSRFR
jgi:hypothetical protein